MSMDDRFLRFQGFHPSDFTRSYLDDKMSALQEAAPYGATLKATFTRRDHAFKGVVTIYSSAGRFFAIASGSKLKEVTQRLVEQLRKQLDRWKSQRFQTESLRDMPIDGDSFNQGVNCDTHGVA